MTSQMNSPVASKFVIAIAVAGMIAAAFLLSHRSPSVAEAATTSAMSPTEMMVNYNRPLRVENWEPAF
jgi:cell division protein FtsN